MSAKQSTANAAASVRAGRQSGGRDAAGGGREFLRRRLIDLGGLSLIVLGAAIVVACATYDAGDPSPNTAGGGPVQNILGVPGAYVSDLLLQSLGLIALTVALAPMVWGVRLLWERRLSRPPLRLVMLALATLTLSAAAASIAPPANWPLSSGLGGFAGNLILGQITALFGVQSWMTALAAGILGLVSMHFALAIKGSEWRVLARAAAWVSSRRSVTDEDEAEASPRVREARKARKAAGEMRKEPKLTRAARKAEAAQSAKPATPAAGGGNAKAKAAETDDAAIVAPPKPKAKPGKRAQQGAQGRLALDVDGYDPPPLSLLHQPRGSSADLVSRDALEKNARLLESVLQDFGVKGEIVKVRPGPVVTRYDLEPAPGTKTSRVIGLADDIARSMSAVSVRVAVVPGSSVIGIELPNAKRETVYLSELLASESFEKSTGKLPLILGKDISGTPMMVDLAKMPHLLVAGTTGSGKSVAVNAMILSLIFRLSPEQCRFIMIDPKMLELSIYDDIPHLLSPVVTDPKKAVVALKWTVKEMEDRYRAMSRLGVRNIDGYNARIEEARRKGEVLTRKVQTGFDPDSGNPIMEEEAFELKPLPQIVVVVDEMADLMLVAGKDIEAAVQRLAQMARAAGIHLIMATQRPSVDVVTGTIKANFPTRISFHVTSKIDSRTILGEPGAEQLLGQGDMLYMGSGGRILRVHGPLVTDDEVESVVGHLKHMGQPDYIEDITVEEEAEGSMLDLISGGGSGDSEGDLYAQALAIVCQHGKASTSFVQRQLQIGYNRAARLVERMEADGAVSPANHVGKREILIRSPEEILNS